MNCKKHPKYEGKNKPKTCLACWCKYIENTKEHYPMNLTLKEGTFLIQALGSEEIMKQLIVNLKI